MRTLSLLGLLAVFVAVVAGASGAQAQKLLDDFKKPMPELTLMSKEEFLKTTTQYEDVPAGDTSLSYSVRLPNDWTEAKAGGISNLSLADKIFGEVALFYSPPKMESDRSRFSIQALKLDYQLTAEQWLLQYLLSNGYSIQAFQKINDERAEAIFVLIENDVSFLIRAAALVNGKRIVLAQYFMPIENWEQEKVVQAQTISSFKLANTDQEYVETMAKYQFLDIAEMYYPESWQIRSPPLRSIDFMDARLLNVSPGEGNDGGELSLDGKIDVQLVSAFAVGSLDEAVEKNKNEFKKNGITLQELMEKPTDFNVGELFEGFSAEVYSATDSKKASQNYEVWMAHMKSGDYYYILSLVTPMRDEDYFTWSRNTQTYRLIIQLMTPQESSVTGGQ